MILEAPQISWDNITWAILRTLVRRYPRVDFEVRRFEDMQMVHGTTIRVVGRCDGRRFESDVDISAWLSGKSDLYERVAAEVRYVGAVLDPPSPAFRIGTRAPRRNKIER